MVWASAVSQRVDTRAAVQEALHTLRAEHARPPDLVLAFVSQHHAAAYDRIAGWLREEVGAAAIAGCSASGVIGAGRELEGREAVSLTAAWLPGVRVRVTHLTEVPAETTPALWSDLLGLQRKQPANFVLFADPTSCDLESLMHGLDEAFPSATKLGGIAGAGAGDPPLALFAGADLFPGGAVVVSFQGACELHSVVSHACRPVGEPFIVTRAHGNIIKELNVGKPAEVLRKVYDAMNARDHSLFNTSLFLGMDRGENRTRYESGDLAIRNVLGIDPDSGAMAVDARVNPYQVVQFHLRDPETASQDLQQRLRDLTRSELGARVRGALLFSCVGRGERLYGVANHDSDAFERRLGPVSLSGFFSNGEISSAGGKTRLHGYASAFALFCSTAKP
jgi:small ligand-binding sensory domain FIST